MGALSHTFSMPGTNNVILIQVDFDPGLVHSLDNIKDKIETGSDFDSAKYVGRVYLNGDVCE